ncbi:MAG: hypothetical protein KA714_24080 [Limnoraphis sp. WC205]|nr:hypothetical protein [Limnoraphis sp. WC205]
MSIIGDNDLIKRDIYHIGLREFYAVTSVDEIGVPQTFLYLDNGFEVDDNDFAIG